VPLVVHRQLLSLLTGVHKIIELPQIHVLMRVIKAARLSFTSLSIVTLAQYMISKKCFKMSQYTSFMPLPAAGNSVYTRDKTDVQSAALRTTRVAVT